jgi:hypothetical protein
MCHHTNPSNVWSIDDVNIYVSPRSRYIEAVFGPPNQFFHGIAGAPYFGIPGDINKKPQLTVDEIFTGALRPGLFEVYLGSI